MSATQPLPTGTVTFLFTDMEGSTRAWEEHQSARGPSGMARGLARHNAIISKVATANTGYVFKTIGDAFCIAFGTADDGLAASIDMQLALAEEDWAALGVSKPVRVRMALHTGPAQEQDGDYFGPTLNRTARILATGHGGQVLVSTVTTELVRDHLLGGMALRDLGEHRLRDLARPERVFQLDCPPLPVDFPSLRSLDSRPHNLPVQLTAFVGRETALADAAFRQRDPGTRLLTLLGPGGTGTTRIALQLAADCLDDFRDGAYFVALAPVRDPVQVAGTITTALGLDTSSRAPGDVLADHVRGRELLMVLDNFEQVVDASSLVGEQLRAAPGLKIVITSRESLRIGGEKVVPIPPLDLPSLRPVPSLQRLMLFEAVRLFIDRAVAVKPDFVVTSENAPAVAEICHRLDGLPLAIELASARIRIFDPESLLARLAQGTGTTLTGGGRDLSARQQTLRGAISWSVDLLSPDERRLFARLGIFFGGFTYQAAEAVGSDADTPGMVGGADVLTALEGLLDKSLLRCQDVAGAASRFRMLETIREHASGLASSTGEAEASRDRHLLHYMLMAEAIEPHLSGADQDDWYDRLAAERDNLREALGWASTAPVTGVRAAHGIRLCVATVDYWQFRGGFSSPAPLLRTILEAVDPMMPGSTAREVPVPGVPDRTLAYGRWAYPHLSQPHPRDDHKPMLEAAAESFRDLRGVGRVLQRLANVHAGTGSGADVVIGFSTGAMDAFRQVGDHRSEVDASHRLAMTEAGAGNEARAREILDRSITVARRHRDADSERNTKFYLASLEHKCGDLEAMSTLIEKVVAGSGVSQWKMEVHTWHLAVHRGDLGGAGAIADSMDDAHWLKKMFSASVLRLEGYHGPARTAFERMRLEFVTNDQVDGLSGTLVALVVLAYGTGDRQAASDHLREAIRIRARAPFWSKLPFAILEVAGLTAADDPSRASRLAALSRGLTARGERWPVFPQDIARVRQVLIDHGADPDLPFPDPMPSEAEVVAEALAALEFVK